MESPTEEQRHGVLAGPLYCEAHICPEETRMLLIPTPTKKDSASTGWSQHSGSSPTKAARGPSFHFPSFPGGTRAQAKTPSWRGHTLCSQSSPVPQAQDLTRLEVREQELTYPRDGTPSTAFFEEICPRKTLLSPLFFLLHSPKVGKGV